MNGFGVSLFHMRWFLFIVLCFSLITCAYGLKPRGQYLTEPDNISFPGYNHCTLLTADGLQLYAWWLPTHSKHKRRLTFVVAGGDSGNMSMWLPLASTLNANGIDVFLFDYRGFGLSAAYVDHFTMDSNYLYYNEFTEDLKAVIRCARQATFSKGNKIALYAFNIGTIIAARAWPDAPPDYFIGEGMITNPMVAQQRLEQFYGQKMTLPADANKHQFRSGLAFPKKMLLFAGERDSVSTVADCLEFRRLGRPGVTIQTFDGGHSSTSILADCSTGRPYLKAMLRYLSITSK